MKVVIQAYGVKPGTMTAPSKPNAAGTKKASGLPAPGAPKAKKDGCC